MMKDWLIDLIDTSARKGDKLTYETALAFVESGFDSRVVFNAVQTIDKLNKELTDELIEYRKRYGELFK